MKKREKTPMGISEQGKTIESSLSLGDGMKQQKKAAKKKCLLYTYCIIDYPTRKQLLLPNKTELGEVHPIAFQDVAALVSEVSPIEFNQQEIDKKTKDLSWLTDTATKHEQVLEHIMNTTIPIPMKLCTIFTSKKNVIEMLKQNYPQFKNNLRRIENKVELGVTAYCNLNILKTKLMQTSQKTMNLQKQISNTTPGKAYFLKQELEELTATETRKQAQTLADEIFQKTKQTSEESVLNNPLSKEATQSTDDMILNAAYLVRKENVETFKTQFQEAKKHYNNFGVELKLTGPWPPYNFCQSDQT